MTNTEPATGVELTGMELAVVGSSGMQPAGASEPLLQRRKIFANGALSKGCESNDGDRINFIA